MKLTEDQIRELAKQVQDTAHVACTVCSADGGPLRPWWIFPAGWRTRSVAGHAMPVCSEACAAVVDDTAPELEAIIAARKGTGRG